MTWFEWALLAVAMAYIGNVLGCLILCETIPKIEVAKKYAWMVPILNLLLFSSFLSEALNGEGFRFLWRFVKTPQKNVFALSVLAQTIKESADRKSVV